MENRIYIEDAKCDAVSGGLDCGEVICTVKFKMNGESQWLTNIEFDGYPNFYLTEEDFFSEVIDGPEDEDEFSEFLDENFISEFGDIELEDAVQSILDNPESEYGRLIKYVFALTRCDWDDLENYINMGKGHYIDEFEVPSCDLLEEEEEE